MKKDTPASNSPAPGAVKTEQDKNGKPADNVPPTVTNDSGKNGTATGSSAMVKTEGTSSAEKDKSVQPASPGKTASQTGSGGAPKTPAVASPSVPPKKPAANSNKPQDDKSKAKDVAAAPKSPAPAQSQPQPQSATPQAVVSPGKSGSGMGVAGLVLSVAALAVGGMALWQGYEQRHSATDVRTEVAQRLTARENGEAETAGMIKQQSEMISGVQAKLGALEDKWAESESQAASLQALYREYASGRTDRALAEISQAITIASQQLSLAGNYEAALIALQGVEARLAEPEYARLKVLRTALLKDIDAIKNHPRTDVSGIALKLDSIIDKVGQLPLPYQFEVSADAALGQQTVEPEDIDSVADTAEQVWQTTKDVSRDVWNEIKNMVRFERTDSSDPVLMAPSQSAFLRENIKLRLLTARLALLGGDQQTFSADLNHAKDAVQRFFDTGKDGVKQVLSELNELGSKKIALRPPSLEETFSALRLVQARPAIAKDLPAEGDSAVDDGTTTN